MCYKWCNLMIIAIQNPAIRHRNFMMEYNVKVMSATWAHIKQNPIDWCWVMKRTLLEFSHVACHNTVPDYSYSGGFTFSVWLTLAWHFVLIPDFLWSKIMWLVPWVVFNYLLTNTPTGKSYTQCYSQKVFHISQVKDKTVPVSNWKMIMCTL